ncbi:hypothetical protein MRX96_010543 [Rhipicephalus microplus]
MDVTQITPTKSFANASAHAPSSRRQKSAYRKIKRTRRATDTDRRFGAKGAIPLQPLQEYKEQRRVGPSRQSQKTFGRTLQGRAEPHEVKQTETNQNQKRPPFDPLKATTAGGSKEEDAAAPGSPGHHRCFAAFVAKASFSSLSLGCGAASKWTAKLPPQSPHPSWVGWGAATWLRAKRGEGRPYRATTHTGRSHDDDVLLSPVAAKVALQLGPNFLGLGGARTKVEPPIPSGPTREDNPRSSGSQFPLPKKHPGDARA